MKECSFFAFRWQDWVLRSCALTCAEIHETSLRGLDVTSCEIGNLLVDLPAVRGMKVTREQAMELSTLLGLVIQ